MLTSLKEKLRRFKTLRKIKHYLARQNWNYLEDVSGVIHIGANIGQERELYDKLDLNVLWIEPIPEIFEQLKENIKPYPKQHALQALITNEDETLHTLHIANNEGESSSIFELDQHTDIWPEIHFVEDITLTGTTLPSLLRREHINPSSYQVLILDTQGSELNILQGARPLLKHFKYIKAEAADFSMYKDTYLLPELEAFMKEHGFKEIGRVKIASKGDQGSCFDIDYKRTK